MRSRAILAFGVTGAVALAQVYRWTVRGALTLDVNVGRSTRALGPFSVDIAAPRETVFDVVAGPYLGRTPRAMSAKLTVLERGADMVLAEHYTPTRGGITATTLETVRFTRPEVVDFRLVRGPVPELTERFTFTATHTATRLAYSGELAADGWAAGRWWADKVGLAWEMAVRASFDGIKAEAERRARASAPTVERPAPVSDGPA
jgi:hypothetical protein